MFKSIVLALFSFAFSAEPTSLAPSARQALLEGNLVAAENILNTIEVQDPSCPLIPLYRGYVQIALGHYLEAHTLFKMALSQNVDERDLQETLFALSLNALLENKTEKLGAYSQEARKSLHFSPHLLFLEGMQHYVEGHFAEAEIALLTYSEIVASSEKGAWIDFFIEHYFPAKTLHLFVIHALIEQGKIAEAKELLAGYDERVQSPYLALCTLKENPHNAAYDRLIALHFAGSNEMPLLIRTRMIAAVREEIMSREVLSLALIEVLERWNAATALEEIAEELISDVAFLFSLEKKGDSPFFAALTKQLLSHLHKHPEKIVATWKELGNSSFVTEALRAEIATLCEKECVRGIAKDDETLIATRETLRVWRELEPDPEKQMQQGNELLHQGKLLWLKEGEEKKGAQLIHLGLSLLPKEERGWHHKSVLRFFENLYVRAENANMIERLLSIHEALELLGSQLPRSASASTLANYLADAEYLFKAHRYSACKTQAELLLKLHGEEEGAVLRLLGLSLYHMGEYDQAAEVLQKIAFPDTYAEKALMLSLSHAGRENEEHLATIAVEEED